MLPLLLALAAMLDASHTVRVGLDDGKFTLVLRHDAGRSNGADYAPRRDPGNPAHQHGLVAKCVCALSTTDDQAPDHVACFARCLAAAQPAGALTPNARSHELPVELEALVVNSTYAVYPARLPQREAHAPPVTSPAVEFPRFVSLLI